jgi:hypothetical protein
VWHEQLDGDVFDRLPDVLEDQLGGCERIERRDERRVQLLPVLEMVVPEAGKRTFASLAVRP